jgi:hypothetical protein
MITVIALATSESIAEANVCFTNRALCISYYESITLHCSDGIFLLPQTRRITVQTVRVRLYKH